MAGDSRRSVLILLQGHCAVGIANISVYGSRKKKNEFFSPWTFSVYLCYLLADNAVSEDDCPGLCSCHSFLLDI